MAAERRWGEAAVSKDFVKEMVKEMTEELVKDCAKELNEKWRAQRAEKFGDL